METLLAAARYAGARRAGYPRLRRPHEVTDLFREWLETHVPLKAAHVLSLVGKMRGGRLYDPRFGKRMKGEGEYAAIIEQRLDRKSDVKGRRASVGVGLGGGRSIKKNNNQNVIGTHDRDK